MKPKDLRLIQPSRATNDDQCRRSNDCERVFDALPANGYQQVADALSANGRERAWTHCETAGSGGTSTSPVPDANAKARRRS